MEKDQSQSKPASPEGQASEGLAAVNCSAWLPISTAPKDGTPFLWFHYITIIAVGEPCKYKPQVEIIRRVWCGKDRQGDGFWMGEYWSKADHDLSSGWWQSLPPEPNA